MELPIDWTVEQRGKPSASFRNDRFELSLKISPRYRSSTSQRPGKAENPVEYRIQIIQDWFSTGVYGDHTRATKVDTWDDAVETAMRFMEEFNQDRGRVPKDKVQSFHNSAEDSETAEALLTVETMTEALVDSVGYTDELLLDTIAEETNEQYRVVAHREGDEIEYLVGEDDDSLDTVQLEKIYATFPRDRLGIKSQFPVTRPVVTTITLSGYIVYRFIFDDIRETNIILNEGTEVVEPIFTDGIRDIVESKWEGSTTE